MDLKNSDADDERLPFGKFYEKKFRGHPVVIGLSLLATGFAAGLGAERALSTVCPCAWGSCQSIQTAQDRA